MTPKQPKSMKVEPQTPKNKRLNNINDKLDTDIILPIERPFNNDDATIEILNKSKNNTKDPNFLKAGRLPL